MVALRQQTLYRPEGQKDQLMKTRNTLSSRAGKTVLEVTSATTAPWSPYFSGNTPLSGLRIFLEYWTVPFYLGSYKRAVQFRLVALNTADDTMEEFEYGSIKPSIIFEAKERPMSFPDCFGFSRNWTLHCVPVSDSIEFIPFDPERYRTGNTLDGIKVEVPKLNWASDMEQLTETEVGEDGEEPPPGAPEESEEVKPKPGYGRNWHQRIFRRKKKDPEVEPAPQPAVPVAEAVKVEPVKVGQVEKVEKKPFLFTIPKV